MYTGFIRLLYILIPIAFYVLGYYGIDILVSNQLLKTEYLGGATKFFVVVNFFILFMY